MPVSFCRWFWRARGQSLLPQILERWRSLRHESNTGRGVCSDLNDGGALLSPALAE